MIDPERPSGGDCRSRAQLMLVGAVTIALIMMGLVVVFNTVLFTQAKPSTDSLDDASEARSWTDQVRNDTQELSMEIFNQTCDVGTPTNLDLSGDLATNLSTLSDVQSLSHAHTGPVYTQIECANCGSTTITPGDVAEVRVLWRTDPFRYENTIAVQLPPPPKGASDRCS